MYSGAEIVAILAELGVTHVVWVPDSEMGQWENDLESAHGIELVRVCREGEAWAIAAGLHLGGKSPVVMIQTTGLFESSDTMRNVIHDLKLPIFAIVGARNWLVKESQDSAKLFAESFVRGWELDCKLIERTEDKPKLAEHYRATQQAAKAGMVLIAEESI